MTFDPFTNRVPFGLLTDEEKAALQAEGPWEAWQDAFQKWWACDSLGWHHFGVYRRAKPPVIMPTVDWSFFAPHIKAVAWGSGGIGIAYAGIPICQPNRHPIGSWSLPDHPSYTLDILPSKAVSRGNCDWKESLVLRPTDT